MMTADRLKLSMLTARACSWKRKRRDKLTNAGEARLVLLRWLEMWAIMVIRFFFV
jgi:hypothetical protein